MWRHTCEILSFVNKNMAPLSDDDRVLIRLLRTDKGWNSYQMIKEFPRRGWTRRTLDRLIKQIDTTGISSSKKRVRKRPVRTPANIARVSELICSQDDSPGTSKSPREIQRQELISSSSRMEHRLIVQSKLLLFWGVTSRSSLSLRTGPQIVQISILWTTRFGDICSSLFTVTKLRIWTILSRWSSTVGLNSVKSSSIVRLTSGLIA